VSFKVVMMANPAMLIEEVPERIRVAGAELDLHTACSGEDELVSMCRDADCVVTHQGFYPFSPGVLQELPNCRFLMTLSIGYDALDVKAATEQGIGIVNLQGFCVEELAEHAMALILGCARWIVILHNRVKSGLALPPPVGKSGINLSTLKGKTLGLVGFGNAARAMVPKGKGFEMRLVAYDPYVEDSVFDEFGVDKVSLDKLAEESDYISVHASLCDETHHLIGLDQFKKMKRSAFIVNTARGPIIDEKALCIAIDKGYIAGAGLDVTDPEPVPTDSPLLKYENIIVTGHRAGSSCEADIVWATRPVEELSRIMRGEWPIGLVNPEVKEIFTTKWGAMNEPE
jgi:D-3-phosphoglycerate dehydrogenase